MFMPRLVVSLAIGIAITSSHLASAQPNAPPAATQTRSVWINPYNSVKVEIGPCGTNLCGWVVWANSEAQQEARDGGTANLVGTELLQNYHSTGTNSWQGRVFVPDMGRSYYSTISKTGPDTLKVSGCILGGLICRSQIWHRA